MEIERDGQPRTVKVLAEWSKESGAQGSVALAPGLYCDLILATDSEDRLVELTPSERETAMQLLRPDAHS